MSPVGWARANLLYDTLSGPPTPDSLQEAVCIVIQRYRKDQEYYLAKAQLLQDRDAFNKYVIACYPYEYKAEKDAAQTLQQRMDNAFKQGPIVITVHKSQV